MDLSVYDVIRRPRISTKVYRLNQTQQQLVLEVHPQANKIMIKTALRLLFNVTSASIRVVVTKGKNKRSGRYTFTDNLRKKAYITLVKGQSLDMTNMASVEVAQQQEGA
jgi:large subunit ribosomal protein L23